MSLGINCKTLLKYLIVGGKLEYSYKITKICNFSYCYVFFIHFVWNPEVKFEEGKSGLRESDYVEILNCEPFVICSNSRFKERDS
jgi:hypothetical protein